MAYKAKEVRKLEELTEKLKSQGDVSQEEADLVYMLRRIYEAYCISTGTLSNTTKQKVSDFLSLNPDLYDSAISFNFVSSFFDPMSEAFKEWYKTVADFTASGHTGNFVTTVPVYDSCSVFSPCREKEKEIARLMKRAIAQLSQEDGITKIAGEKAKEVYSQAKNCLSCDLLFEDDFPCPILTFSRYGLISRSVRKSNDVLFVRNTTEKLKKEGDISIEEADAIFTIIKFIQAFKVRRLCYRYEKSAIKIQANVLKDSLSDWFKEVYKMAKAGKTGNFLYTLPIKGLNNLGRSLTYIKKALNLLPEQFVVAKLPRKPALPDMAGVFFDEERNVLMSQRYSVVREIVKPERYAIFHDNWGAFCRTEVLKTGDSRLKENYGVYLSGIRNLCGKIEPSVVKFEYLSRKGILPVCLLCQPNDLRDKYCVAYKEEDRTAIEKVLKISDEKLSLELPANSLESDFMKSLDESVYVLSILLQRTDIVEEDDSWVDIER